MTTISLLLALGIVLLIHGSVTVAYIHRSAPSGCPSDLSVCSELNAELLRRYQQLAPILLYLALAPIAIGAFWGAPLSGSEYERGTSQLAWTQSVPRRRWLGAKLLVLTPITTGLGFALGAMITAWLGVFHGMDLPGVPPDGSFSILRGIAPAGWWLCAFMVGVAVGAALRRTVAAMAVTIVVLIAMVMVLNLSPFDSFLPTKTALVDSAPVAAAFPQGSIVDYLWLDPEGRAVPDPAGTGIVERSCPTLTADANPDRCLVESGYRALVTFRPDAFWSSQRIELGVLLAFAALAAKLADVTIRRARA